MARYTPVYGAFVVRLGEVDLLRSSAAALGRKRTAIRHGAEISALCRGAVVLLSSHIEAFVKELGEHTLDAIYDNQVCKSKVALPFFYHLSKDRIESIRNSSSAEKIAEHVRIFVQDDAQMWGVLGNFPRPITTVEFNTGFSNPKFDKVKAYFGRFGYVNFRRDFFRELGRNAQPTVNAIDQIVDARNSIAHGDPAATKTPQELTEMIYAAKLFCRNSDNVFANWCGINLCRIR